MVHLGHVALAVSAITGVFAAPTADPDAPDFLIGPQNLARRQDYNQNYKTGGNVNFSPSNNGYSVTFSGAGDFVVGKGWKTGTNR
jgi:endo-1,4-beta-xylanase